MRAASTFNGYPGSDRKKLLVEMKGATMRGPPVATEPTGTAASREI